MELKPNLIQRVTALFNPRSPAERQSHRMPDLERWVMPHRSVDIRDWETARNMATNVLRPDRSKLMDLYDSILVDSHLASAMESRVLRVRRSRFRLMRDGEPQPDLLPLLQQKWFDDVLRYVAEARFRGHTLIELGELAAPGQLKAVHRIDPRNVLPWSGVVVRRQGEETGYDFRKPPLSHYLIEVGQADELGLLADVAPVAIIKKYAVGSWSDYVHKYGIPPRWVRTNSRDVRRYKQLEKMMQQMLSSAYGVIEGDEEIQIMQTPGTDAFRVFDELISRMNSEMSKRILGQDATTDNKDASGTYGSLKVMQGVAEDRHQADKATVSYVINNELFPRLVNLGYPLQGIRFEWDALQDMSPTELVDAVSKLGMVFDIDPEHVEERTGIKILGARRMPGELGSSYWPAPPGTPRGGRPPADPPEPGNDDDPDDDDPDGVRAFRNRQPIGFKRNGPSLDRRARSRLRKINVGPEQRHGQHPDPALCQCGGPIDVIAQAPRMNEEAVESLVRAAYDGLGWNNAYFSEVATHLIDGLMQQWRPRMAQLAYDAPDHAAAAAMELNVFQFSAIKTVAAIYEMNQAVRDSKGYADFKRKVDGIIQDYNGNKLAAEYQLAVNTGMQTSRYYQLVEDSDSMPWWEYVTMGDGQVRDSHAALDGKVFAANDPIWDRIYPPNGWGCRCTVLPVAFEPKRVYTEREGLAIMQQADPNGYAAMERGGFLRNRAQTNVVFDNNLQYRDQLKAKELKDREEYRKERKKAGDNDPDMPPKEFVFGVEKSYGRKGMDMQSLRKTGLGLRPQGPGSKADALAWYDSSATTDRNGDPVLVMTDYSGRKIHLTRSHFSGHMSEEGRRSQRHEVASLLPDILNNPDEVWMEKAKKTGHGSLNYMKLYQDHIVSVAVRTKDGRLEVATWTGDLNEAQRQGLLIKPYVPHE